MPLTQVHSVDVGTLRKAAASWTITDTPAFVASDVPGSGRAHYTLKSECLNKLILLGERHLRRAVSEFVEHYHLERNHQGLDNRLLTPLATAGNENAPIAHRERLGGLLNYYYRDAA